MSLVNDIVKFCEDLLFGDFEDNLSNVVMIVGGLIFLILVVDQVMDVCDVSGMVFCINKCGIRNCSIMDWVDLFLVIFGVIFEVGSVFKMVVKLLWKNCKKWKFVIQCG